MAAWNSNSIPHRYDGVYNNNGDEGAEFSSDISDSEEDIESWFLGTGLKAMSSFAS